MDATTAAAPGCRRPRERRSVNPTLAAPAAASGHGRFADAAKSVAGAVFPFLVVGALWEIVAHLGVFPAAVPAARDHRFGFRAAHLERHPAAARGRDAVPPARRLRDRRQRRRRHRHRHGTLAPGPGHFLPLVSIGAPIPGLAYAPLFLLWFGLGNLAAILLVGFVAMFPVILNTWTGVKAVKEIWLRSAGRSGQATGACSARSSCRGRCPTSSPGCGSASRRPGASSSPWRCSPPCPGGSAGSSSAPASS